MPRSDWDDDWYEEPAFYSTGQMHDLRDADNDPRNPRLIGLKSVSYDAACALKRTEPRKPRHRVGFHRPR